MEISRRFIIRTQGRSGLCTKLEMDSSIRSKELGSRNFGIWSRDPGHAHLGDIFMVHTQQGSILHLCTKFEADCLIRSKVINWGPKNLEIRS